MGMNIQPKELNSCLWTEWKNGMKIMAESLMNVLETAQKEIGK